MSIKNSISEIFSSFNHNSELATIKELVSGHINDTYLIITKEGPNFILQRINHLVFKDVPGLTNNKVLVTQHLKSKIDLNGLDTLTLTFVPTKKGQYYYKDKLDNYWNLMLYIENSKNFEKVTNKNIAYEAGKLFGTFLNLTSDIDATLLTDTIPNFHNMEFRFLEFDNAFRKASLERLKLSEKEIKKVLELKEYMLILHNLKKDKKTPIRVTHNDTKISNALFTSKNKGLCVIDLDTVMPGIIHYDFGDAIRTICNNAEEDEKDLTKVTFNIKYYKAFVKGFLKSQYQNISKIEADYLATSAKIMTFIMALRMLTDFLNDDIYYKIKYELHNLDRAKNQLKLIEDMDMKFKKMESLVTKYLK